MASSFFRSGVGPTPRLLLMIAAALSGSSPAQGQLPFATHTSEIPGGLSVMGQAAAGDVDDDGAADVWHVQDGNLWVSFAAGHYGGAVDLGRQAVAVAMLQDHFDDRATAFSISVDGELHRWTVRGGDVTSEIEAGTWVQGTLVDVETWSFPGAAVGFVVARDQAGTFHPRIHTQQGTYLASYAPLSLGPVTNWTLADIVDGDAVPSIVAYDEVSNLILISEVDGADTGSQSVELPPTPRLCGLRHTGPGQMIEEVVLTSWDGATARLHLLGYPNFETGTAVGTSEALWITSARVDGDSYADACLAQDDGVVIVPYGNGQPFATTPTWLGARATGTSQLVAADFDGDGDLDLRGAYGSFSGGQAPASIAVVYHNQLTVESNRVSKITELELLQGPPSGPSILGDSVVLTLDPPATPLPAGEDYELRILAWDGTTDTLNDPEFRPPPDGGAWIVDVDETWTQPLEVELNEWPAILGTTSLFYLELRLVQVDGEAETVLPSTFFAGVLDQDDPAFGQAAYAGLIAHPTNLGPIATRGKVTPGVIHTSGRPRPIDPIPLPGPEIPPP